MVPLPDKPEVKLTGTSRAPDTEPTPSRKASHHARMFNGAELMIPSPKRSAIRRTAPLMAASEISPVPDKSAKHIYKRDIDAAVTVPDAVNGAAIALPKAKLETGNDNTPAPTISTNEAKPPSTRGIWNCDIGKYPEGTPVFGPTSGLA
jgi:hypothetical protein